MCQDRMQNISLNAEKHITSVIGMVHIVLNVISESKKKELKEIE